MLRTLILYPPRLNQGLWTLLATDFLGLFAETRVFVDAGEVVFRAALVARALAEYVVGLVCCAHVCGLLWLGVVEGD
jgi:hypothetical protein